MMNVLSESWPVKLDSYPQSIWNFPVLSRDVSTRAVRGVSNLEQKDVAGDAARLDLRSNLEVSPRLGNPQLAKVATLYLGLHCRVRSSSCPRMKYKKAKQ